MKHILRLTIILVVLILMGSAMTEAGRHKKLRGHEPGGLKNISGMLLQRKADNPRTILRAKVKPDLILSPGGGTARTFISGGSQTFDWCNGVAIQSDDKIVAVGSSQDQYGRNAIAVARFHADGSIDTNFGTNGSVRAFIGGADSIHDGASDVAIQSDGKIVTVGGTVFPPFNEAFAVARFNANGSIDDTFGTNGTVTTFIDGGDAAHDDAAAVAIQPDGKIVAAGRSGDASYHSALALARFNADGSIDSTFGTNGNIRTYLSLGNATMNWIESIALQPDGKIVVAGVSVDSSSIAAFALARFNTDGGIDSTFGTNGSVRSFVSVGGFLWDEANWVGIQPDGKIIAAGCSEDSSGNDAFAVARFNADGTPDSTFGTNGGVLSYITGGDGTDD